MTSRMIQNFRLWLGHLFRKSSNIAKPSEGTDWLIVLLVWAAGLGAAAQFGKVAIALDEFRVVYDVGEVGLGFLISCVGIVGLVFGVIGGKVITQFGIKRTFVVGMLGAAILSALQSLTMPFILIVALRIIEGASHLAVVVAGPILMARHSSASARGAVMTLWSSFFGLSYMFVALIAPILIKTGGLSFLLQAHALYMLVLGALLWLALPPSKGHSTVPVAPQRFRLSDLKTLHIEIYKSPWLGAAALGFVFYTGLYIALLSYLPLFVDAIHRSNLSASLPLASIVTSLTLGVILLKFFHPVTVVIFGFLLTALSSLPLLLTLGNDQAFIIACLILLGATGIIPGASFAALAALNTNDQDRAYATGAIAQLGNVGTTCGPPVLAAIVASTGLVGTVIFVVLFSLCGIFIHLWLTHRRKIVLAQRD